MGLDENSLVIIDSVDSTNNYAMGLIREGMANHGAAYFAIEQTAGKGRRNKGWITEPGKNILLSIIVQPAFISLNKQFELSVAVALGCHDFFKNYAGENVYLKWPNDIFWNDRKAGGILIENVIKGKKWKWSVIGIGININQTKFSVKGNFLPVSLKQITGKNFNVVKLANELYAFIMSRYIQLQKNDFKKMLAEYNSHLFALDKKVKFKKDNILFNAFVKGVNENGQIITNDGLERLFSFDEVEWVKI